MSLSAQSCIIESDVTVSRIWYERSKSKKKVWRRNEKVLRWMLRAAWEEGVHRDIQHKMSADHIRSPWTSEGHMQSLWTREKKDWAPTDWPRTEQKTRTHFPLFSGVLLCTISKLAWLLACFNSHTADKYPGNCLAKFQGGKSKGICLSRAGQKSTMQEEEKKITANNGRWRNRNINCMHTRLGKV